MSMDDSFTMFRKKKEMERAAQLAAKAAVAIEAETTEAGRPKGFRRGRFKKPAAPVQGVAPKGMKAFRKSGAAVPGAPKPRGFDRMRAPVNPVDPAALVKPSGFDPGRAEKPFGRTDDVVPPPPTFETTRVFSKPLDPKTVSHPKGFKRY